MGRVDLEENNYGWMYTIQLLEVCKFHHSPWAEADYSSATPFTSLELSTKCLYRNASAVL